jgi:hypothetical protein
LLTTLPPLLHITSTPHHHPPPLAVHLVDIHAPMSLRPNDRLQKDCFVSDTAD